MQTIEVDIDREYNRIKQQEYRERNREEYNKYMRDYLKQWRQENPDKINEYQKRYRKKLAGGISV